MNKAIYNAHIQTLENLFEHKGPRSKLFNLEMMKLFLTGGSEEYIKALDKCIEKAQEDVVDEILLVDSNE